MNHPVVVAVQSENLQVLKSLITPGRMTAEDQQRLQNIFFELAVLGTSSAECFEYLINFVDINLPNPQQRTGLHLAAFFGHFIIAECLVRQKNIRLDQKTSNGCTALYFASCKGFASVVKLLLGAGADPNAYNKSGSTPLIVASYNGHYDTVENLLQHQADPNHQNSSGMTAMHAAASNGYTDILDLLQQYGGSSTMADDCHRTPGDILQSKRSLHVLPMNDQNNHPSRPLNHLKNPPPIIDDTSMPTWKSGYKDKANENAPSSPQSTNSTGINDSCLRSRPRSWRCASFKALICQTSSIPNLSNDESTWSASL